jgi:hypothetical protein
VHPDDNLDYYTNDNLDYYTDDNLDDNTYDNLDVNTVDNPDDNPDYNARWQPKVVIWIHLVLSSCAFISVALSVVIWRCHLR